MSPVNTSDVRYRSLSRWKAKRCGAASLRRYFAPKGLGTSTAELKPYMHQVGRNNETQAEALRGQKILESFLSMTFCANMPGLKVGDWNSRPQIKVSCLGFLAKELAERGLGPNWAI